jgi:hypothetical protein
MAFADALHLSHLQNVSDMEKYALTMGLTTPSEFRGAVLIVIL